MSLNILIRERISPSRMPVFAAQMSYDAEEAQEMVAWLERMYPGCVEAKFTYNEGGKKRMLNLGSNIIVSPPDQDFVRVHPSCYAVIFMDGHLEDVPKDQFKAVGWMPYYPEELKE